MKSHWSMGMDNSFRIRLRDPISDNLNGFGDKYPLSYLAREMQKNIKSLWERKGSFMRKILAGEKGELFWEKARKSIKKIQKSRLLRMETISQKRVLNTH